MTLRFISKLLFAFGAAGLALTAIADDTTGLLRGRIVGTPAADVAVENIDRGLVYRTTASDGSFRIGNLPPGEYTVTLTEGGSVIDQQIVEVKLGSSTSLTMGSAMEELIVQGARVAAVDIAIAESGLVISTEELQELPVGRSLSSVTLLAPGVIRGDNAFGSNTSFAGSSVAENTSYINGLNTTNFRNGLGFSTVPFEFYDTIQVKTGGYSAKYGRSTGGVINSITKSGSNEFKMGVNAYQSGLATTGKDTYGAYNDKDVSRGQTYDFWASGAIWKDKIFFYVLGSEVANEFESYGKLGGLAYFSDNSSTFWGGKLDAYITDNHHFEYTAFSDEADYEEDIYNYTYEEDEDGSNIRDAVGDYFGTTIYSRGGDNWIATYTGRFGDNVELSVSYGENEANRTTLGSTDTIPTVINWSPDAGFEYIGVSPFALIEVGQDKREMLRANLSFDLGDHLIELGIDNEVTTATNNSQFPGGLYILRDPTGIYNSNRAWSSEDNPVPNARYRDYRIGGSFDTESDSFYLQDTWYVNDRLTIELGLRNESFNNMNSAGAPFIKVDDQLAPRISAVFDPTGDSTSKIFGSFGRYYLPVAANTNIRLSGGETYIHTYYAWDGVSADEYDVPTNLGAVLETQVFADGDVPDTRSVTDANIEPMYQEEYVLGYDKLMDSGWNIGIKAMVRDLKVSIEDVAIDAGVIRYYNAAGSWDEEMAGGTVEEVFTGFHQYVLTNPGNDMRIFIPEQDEFIDLSSGVLQYPGAKRKYRALEMTASKMGENWYLSTSYTLASSKGNNEGYVRSDNGQDDAGLTTNFDQPGLTDYGYGDLPNHRKHTIKAFGYYRFADIGNGSLQLGANASWISGRPKNCFGVHPTDGFAAAYGDESFFCDGEPTPRGSLGTTSDVFRLDVNTQYTFEMGDSELDVSLDIFNILNMQKPTEINESEPRDGINPYSGLTTAYQSPRQYRVSLRFTL